MAKPLTAMMNPGMTALNNSGTNNLSINIPVAAIQLRDVFKNLFPINEKLVEELAEEMKKKGFDKSQPVHIWQEENVLIDGHHRLLAAKKANLYDVPVFKHSFESEKDALLYALGLQIKRRNLDDAGKFEVFLKIDELKNPGKKSTPNIKSGKSAADTAEQMGISTRQAEKLRNIASNGDDEIKEAVKKGEISINKADKKINESKKRNIKKLDDDCEALNDNTENPQGLNFNHSDGHERPVIPVTAELDNDKEKIRIAQENFARGFETGVYFVIAEFEKGLSPKEIFADERLKDFSPSVICKFELPEDDKEIIDKFLN